MTSIYPNAIDLLMVIVIMAMVHFGGRKGVIIEGFELFGIFCALLITVHYYARFAKLLRVQFFGKEASTEFAAFALLSIWVYTIFVLIGKGWALILNFEVRKKVDHYGGMVLAGMQAYFMCGMIFFALLLTTRTPLYSRTQKAVSAHLFRYVAVDFYRAGYSVFVKKAFPYEPFNKRALEIVAEERKNNQILWGGGQD